MVVAFTKITLGSHPRAIFVRDCRLTLLGTLASEISSRCGYVEPHRATNLMRGPCVREIILRVRIVIQNAAEFSFAQKTTRHPSESGAY